MLLCDWSEFLLPNGTMSFIEISFFVTIVRSSSAACFGKSGDIGLSILYNGVYLISNKECKFDIGKPV